MPSCRYDNGLTTSVRDVAHTDSRSVFHTPLSPGALAEVSSDLLSTKQFGVHLEVYVCCGFDFTFSMLA